MIAAPNNIKESVNAGARLLSDTDYSFIETGYRESLLLRPGVEHHLHGVLADALAHPGSMARAQISFSIMTARGANREHARALAVAIEYFHTASLLFDDLPSMDNAEERRGRSCPHILYGEAAAQLGALGFITRAYALLWDALADLPAARRREASKLVEDCLGANGILNGQSRDLHFHEGEPDAERALEIARGKTVSLIRLTVVLPALVMGADESTRARFEELAEAWGQAYQMLDDFKDCFLTFRDTGKTAGRDAALGRPNYVMAAGVAAARREMQKLLATGEATLTALENCGWGSSAMRSLQNLLQSEMGRVESRLSIPA